MINWNFNKNGVLPIGLDIGRHSIKAIQLRVDNEKISVIDAEKVFIGPDVSDDWGQRREFIVSSIKEILAYGNFMGKKVVSCLSNDQLKMTSLRLTQTEDESIENALKKEVAERFGLDEENDIVNYIVAGDVRQGDERKKEYIVFAVADKTIKDHIKMLNDAGVVPVGIDAIPFALFRSFRRSRRREEDDNNTAVFVDIGSRYTTVVFGRNGEISFVKQIPVGIKRFDSELSSRLEVELDDASRLRRALRLEQNGNPEKNEQENSATIANCLDSATKQIMVDAITNVSEELVREISLCFRYYTVTFRGKQVKQAVFAGGGAYENLLIDVLKRQLSVDIEVAHPLRGFNLTAVDFDSDRRKDFLCEWTVAVGAGLKKLNLQSSILG
ncbi:MAG: pilus assembly protein PilM [Planctomycetota bacterium]